MCAAAQQAGVGDLAHAVVAEVETSIDLAEDAAAHQFFHSVRHVRFGQARSLREYCRIEIPTNDCANVGQATRPLAEVGEAPGGQRAHLIGEFERSITVLKSSFPHGPRTLDNDEWVPLAEPPRTLGQLPRGRVVS
jgi:hypothetical protein